MFLFSESPARENLFPITLTRQVADIRVGILTIREKWDLSGLETPDHAIDAAIFPKQSLANGENFPKIDFPWQIPAMIPAAIQEDLELMKGLITREAVPGHVKVMGDPNLVYIEKGAQLEHCYLNTSSGPVHIASGALVMDGAMLRGPVSIGAGTVVKMGAAIYGSAIGPQCIIGGEVKGSQFQGNSNKAHDGYIGDAVIGEWCNIGAGTSCSNLRNNAAEVKVWHMKRREYMTAGLKCGLIMGDHSKCAINTSFNTGTAVGVCANIFQSGPLTPKYIPSFSWGADGREKYRLDKALSDINNWMGLRGSKLDQQQINNLTDIYNSQL